MESILRSSLSISNKQIILFDHIMQSCLDYTDAPVHSIQEMREKRSTKVKGDLFETFCVLYLRSKGYRVWLLKDIPDDIRMEVGLGKWDVGIDVIAYKNNRYNAVQCKFKRSRKGTIPGTFIPYNCVNWKEVSTFF